MSVVEYLKIWHRCSREIDWQTEREWLKLIYKRFIPDGTEDDISDVSSLLNKLEEKNLLGIDRLNVLKEVLKEAKKWDLLRILKQFEVKRKEYRQLLEQINRALEGSIELQRLISICSRQNLIAHEREEHIVNVNSLFTELEQQNNLGVENLSILRTIATEVNKPELCRLLDDFDDKREHEEDAERERKEWEDYRRRAQAQAASVLAIGMNIGERVIGVVTPHCTFRNLTGGAVVVTTWMVLHRSPSMEAFVDAFKEAVLPFGNCLRAISEGSIRFTIQAESMSALNALWKSHQDETLRTNLQEFLITEEIKQLAGGEVSLTVYIDEDEYRNAMFDLMVSETEEMKLEEKRGLKDRANSDSDLLRERKMTTDDTKDPSPEREFLPFDRKVRVEEYLENLQETYSEITQPSDSGVGTWSSAPSEFGSGKGDIIERLDEVDGFIKDAIENLRSFQDAYPFQVPVLHKVGREMKRCRIALKASREMEKKWMSAEPILASSRSPEVIIEQLRNSLQLDEDYFRKPTSKDKTAIRALARKAKNLMRVDVFDYLRKITPTGTTGPRFSDDLLIVEISKVKKESLSFALMDHISRHLHNLEPLNLLPKDAYRVILRLVSALHIITKRNGLRTVGELYDFLCELGLSATADKL